MKFSSLITAMKPNILQVLDAKRHQMISEGKEVINLSAGTPDLHPAPHVMKAMQEACADPNNYAYTLMDIPPLQEAVINWYKNRYNVELTEKQLLGLYGSQEGFAHIFQVLCEPGDTVIVGTPGYPIFLYAPVFARANLFTIPLKKENGFLIDFSDIPEETAIKAKAIVVSYPSNPLCATAPDSFYEELIEFAKKYDIAVIHDNAYSEYIHDGKPGGSFLRFPGAMDVGIEFNSLSKSFNMTGLRISFALGNEDIIQAFTKLRTQIDYGLSIPDQMAAIAALTGPRDIVEKNRAQYKLRRDTFYNALNEIGWEVPLTAATMFTWYPIPKGYKSDEFCLAMLEKAGVICVPGSSFGEGGEGWVRFALVAPPEKLKRAAHLIDKSGILN
ncbi:MAG: aminotransferase class I/II-fold pyridoxal phosphate-dependent enzyme [Lachnospiraceae bacterium]|jgi:LL-diaminopimelate aminotransferase|nr:aminotransferase class I/II-fold pyridoxal phosphate-dependent enzyme [Lachnospiraceae bacterium]